MIIYKKCKLLKTTSFSVVHKDEKIKKEEGITHERHTT